MVSNGQIIGNVGIYLRLSREDGDKMESDSIRNQRELLTEFMQKNKRMKLIDEYVDDGFSGTNFNRPSFSKMMEDIKRGRINCILVKDLSRLGRNYIETGRYLERIFPSLGVRVIAVNDNYDSADNSSDENSIIVPFKNLINDAYCRDISLKIRSHLDVKRKNGQFIGSFAGYGYIKDPKNKNHLIVDEYAASVVEKIFDMRLLGFNSGRIADRLNDLGIEPPYEYKRSCGMKYDCGFRSAAGAKWGPDTVSKILKNNLYTGTTEQGKRRKVNYKVKKRIPVDRNDWICVEGTHDAIIPKDKFDEVQKLLRLDTRTPPSKDEVFPLCGYVVCGHCGQSMVRRTSSSNGKKYCYYHCSTYKKSGGCSSHIINCQKVEHAVLKAIQNQIELLDKIEPILKMIQDYPNDLICIRTIDKQLEKLQQEIEYYGVLKARLYKDMVDGIIERKEYPELNKRFDQSREATEKTYFALVEKKESILSGRIKSQPWINEIKKYRNITSLTRPVVVALLDKVEVINPTEIHVRFLFEDEINEMMKYAEQQNNGEDVAV